MDRRLASRPTDGTCGRGRQSRRDHGHYICQRPALHCCDRKDDHNQNQDDDPGPVSLPGTTLAAHAKCIH